MSKRYFPEDLTIKKTKSIVALAGKPQVPCSTWSIAIITSVV